MNAVSIMQNGEFMWANPGSIMQNGEFNYATIEGINFEALWHLN
jgi:hypothetical protein